MKQRITYLVPEGTGIDPSSIVVEPHSLEFKNARLAALEKRVTVGLSELPQELRILLKDCHELHVRWSSHQAHDLIPPLVSRVPPGLHVFFTPRKSDREVQLCPLIQRLFGKELKCESVSEAFSRPPILSERFASSASYQFFQVQHSLTDFVVYLQNKICLSASTERLSEACESQSAALLHAAYVDIDFDIISHAVTLTAAWSPVGSNLSMQSMSQSAQSNVEQISDESVEVGVLSTEKADEPEELKLGGYLTVLGQDSKPSATLFSFPSRHHPLPLDDHTAFNVSFLRPTGLHPTLSIGFLRSSLKRPHDACALHAYITLPSALFLDRYQLSDRQLLESNHLRALHALSGADDLEAPDWAVQTWGSAALVELSHPPQIHSQPASDSDIWEVQLPLHLRYVQSSPNTTDPSYRDLAVPWPSVFWACEAEDGLKMGTNPFDRVNLGYDGLFGPKTMFFHIPPAAQDAMSTVRIPVLNPSSAWWVPGATSAVVMVGIGWVLWSLLLPLVQSKPAGERAKRE